jgi:hypothetical protein
LILLALERVVPGNRLCSSRSLAGGRPPPFLMPRGGLLFWVLVSILLSVVLTVVLNLLLLL